MHAQISYDLVMEDEMSFVEGTFRLSGREWQVFIFCRDSTGSPPAINADARWETGVTGVVVKWPRGRALNRAVVLRVLSEQLGIAEWEEVRGPNSMQLR